MLLLTPVWLSIHSFLILTLTRMLTIRAKTSFNSFLSDTNSWVGVWSMTRKSLSIHSFLIRTRSPWPVVGRGWSFQFIPFWYHTMRGASSGCKPWVAFNSFLSDTTSMRPSQPFIKSCTFNSFLSDTEAVRAVKAWLLSGFQFIPFWYTLLADRDLALANHVTFNSFLSDTQESLY